MRTFLLGLLYALASGFYWWMVTVISYGLFGGSTRPGGAPPSASYALATTVATITLSLVVYALLFVLLRNMIQGRRKEVGQ